MSSYSSIYTYYKSNYLLPLFRHCERMRSNPGVKIPVLSVQRCYTSPMISDVSFHCFTPSWIASHSLAMTELFVGGRIVIYKKEMESYNDKL